jgi:uncharacterized protein
VTRARDPIPPGKVFSETIEFRGHRNILGTHRNTLEITKVSEISRRADCIVGVAATKSCADIDARIINHLRSNGRMEFRLSVSDLDFHFFGFGSQNLQLTDDKEIVLRKSDFISPRTLAIHCDAAAIDLPRQLVELLQDPETIGMLEINTVETLDSSFDEITNLEALDAMAK